ncbi:MAG: hypothetical protein R3D71_01065 [Rickettsiales bacterium]
MKKTFITISTVLAMTSTVAMASEKASDKKPQMDGHKQGKMCKKGWHAKKWEKIDTNKDGVITKEEAQAFHDKKFKMKDANGDGKITKDEWQAHHEAKREKMKEMKKKMEEKAGAAKK